MLVVEPSSLQVLGDNLVGEVWAAGPSIAHGYWRNRGHNLYPQDIEQTIEREVDVVRKGRVAAFAVTHDGQDGIGIAAEISRSVQKILPAEALIKLIRQTVAEAYQEAPSVVVLLNPGALPKSRKPPAASCSVRPAATGWPMAASTATRCSLARRRPRTTSPRRWSMTCNC